MLESVVLALTVLVTLSLGVAAPRLLTARTRGMR